MSNNHIQNHKSCAFGEQTVSYLYDEIDSIEKSKFESHLQNCSDCTAELANFGSVCSSIQEWRDAEFASIKTPIFEISINQINKPVSKGFSVWIANLREVFTLKPVLAAAAFAFVAVCAGLLLFESRFSKADELAVKVADNNSSNINPAPTIEKIIAPLKDSSGDSITESSAPQNPSSREPKVSKSENASVNRTLVKDSVNKISASNRLTKASDSESVQSIKDSNKTMKKSPTVQKPQMPIYSSVEDEDDKSVRLADLFDEIDSK